MLIKRQDLNLDLLWKGVLGEIELNVNPSIYATWFKKTKLLSNDDQNLIIGVPNAFAQRQLETQFEKVVKQAIAKNNIEHQTLKYRIYSTDETSSSKNSISVTSSSPKKHWVQSSGPGLNPRYTFESFISGSGNDLAHAACQAIVESLGNKYNPLFIYGGVGIGKTHLIQSVGNAIMQQRSDLKVAYLTIERFVQEFTDAIRYRQKGSFTRRYRNIDVLIIDDIQFIANKEKTQEEFFHTFNALYEAGKQIIISSDKPPQAIPTLQERLQSRFQMGMMIDMQVPDMETRCAILKYKADHMKLKMDEDCVQLLATSISTNIRVLEGALNQLNAFCETNKIPLATEQLAKQILNQHFKKKKGRKPSPKQVIEVVAKYHDASFNDLIGPRRDKDIVWPRQVAMYLMRNKLHLSFPKIARQFGKKDHTTAIYGVDKISRELTYDADTKQVVGDLIESLKL